MTKGEGHGDGTGNTTRKAMGESREAKCEKGNKLGGGDARKYAGTGSQQTIRGSRHWQEEGRGTAKGKSGE